MSIIKKIFNFLLGNSLGRMFVVMVLFVVIASTLFMVAAEKLNNSLQESFGAKGQIMITLEEKENGTN